MRRTGTSTSTILESPAKRRRRDRARRRQEAAWAARSGPVTVRHVDPATLRAERPER
jgi:hypothetical protein